MKPTEIPLKEGKFYHVYNRGNNGENLYYSNENYKYFLRKYDEYLSGYVDTYAYCLLPNHFHLLISLKVPNTSRVPPFQKVEPLNEQKVEPLEKLVSFQFRKFFTSYSMSINKQQKRKGSLLQKNFKRREVTNTTYLTNLVFYIHANPQLHGITDDFRMYPWSSYNGIIANKPTKLKKEELVHWFENKENYLTFHSQKADLKTIKNLILEENGTTFF